MKGAKCRNHRNRFIVSHAKTHIKQLFLLDFYKIRSWFRLFLLSLPSAIINQISDMPNRKDLKKSINAICSAVLAECVAVSLYHGKAEESNVNALLASILATRDDFISRISHPEPGMSKKAYYDHLAANFSEQISEIIDHICNLSE